MHDLRTWMLLVSDPITEAVIPQGLATPITNLRKHGWRLVNQGVGKFGAVMMHRDRPHLVKLFQRSDMAYRAFIELALAHANPHFPKFTGTILDATQDYSVIRVERLTPNASGAMFKFCHITGLYMETLNDESAPGIAGQSVRQARDWVAAQSPDLKTACDLLAGLLSRFNLDLEARNNVMMRGPTFVFSDPLALALD